MSEILKINKKAKIIFASADMSVKQKALSLGACEFLDKPFKMQKLLTTIQKLTKEVILNIK